MYVYTYVYCIYCIYMTYKYMCIYIHTCTYIYIEYRRARHLRAIIKDCKHK